MQLLAKQPSQQYSNRILKVNSNDDFASGQGQVGAGIQTLPPQASHKLLENDAERMNCAMTRIREMQDGQTSANAAPVTDDRSQTSGMHVQQNPFKDRHQSAMSGTSGKQLDGGLFYGMNERDQWLLAKDAPTTDDEIYTSEPHKQQ